MTWDYEDGDKKPDKAELAARLKRQLDLLREERGAPPAALSAPARGNLCSSFWGRHWCRHVEDFSYWAQRVPRGRSLLRKGAVYNASIKEGLLCGHVFGDDLYEVRLKVAPIEEDVKKHLAETAKKSALSLLDLLSGKPGDALIQELTLGEYSLFPRPGEITASCTCPDWADLCEHGAALLYGAGLLFEKNPELLFIWRGLDLKELLPDEISLSAGESKNHDLDEEDLPGLFGIEMEEDSPESV